MAKNNNIYYIIGALAIGIVLYYFITSSLLYLGLYLGVAIVGYYYLYMRKKEIPKNESTQDLDLEKLFG